MLQSKAIKSSLKRTISEISNSNSNTNKYGTIKNTKGSNGSLKVFLYFIGRLNPPHDGHIYALQQMINESIASHSKALILLGSGPKQKNGDKRTMDDPITFETKKVLVESRLNGVEGVDYIIQEMTNPTVDILGYIKDELDNQDTSNLKEIKILQFAGGKDGDASKLMGILNAVSTIIEQNNPGIIVETDVVEIEARPSANGQKSMSATEVRNITYKTYLDRTGFEGWPQQYKNFYGPMAETIYNEILYPLQKIPDETQKRLAIENYIESGTLLSSVKVLSKLSTNTKRKTIKLGGLSRKSKKYFRKNKRTKRKHKISYNRKYN